MLRLDGNAYVATSLTTVTDTLGNYKFDNLAIGTYRVVETQPLGYFSVGATPGKVDGQVRGTVLTSDILSGIDLLGGENSVRNDFAEALSNSIGGFVGIDCEHNANPPPIAGVVIRLLDAAGATGAHHHDRRQRQLPVRPSGRRHLHRRRRAAGRILSRRYRDRIGGRRESIASTRSARSR